MIYTCRDPRRNRWFSLVSVSSSRPATTDWLIESSVGCCSVFHVWSMPECWETKVANGFWIRAEVSPWHSGIAIERSSERMIRTEDDRQKNFGYLRFHRCCHCRTCRKETGPSRIRRSRVSATIAIPLEKKTLFSRALQLSFDVWGHGPDASDVWFVSLFEWLNDRSFPSGEENHRSFNSTPSSWMP